MADRSEFSGSFSAPPAGAPVESTQPLREDVMQAQIAKARANERELPPFNPQKTGPVEVDVPRGTKTAEDVLAETFQTPTISIPMSKEDGQSLARMDGQPALKTGGEYHAPEPTRNPQPAASDSDSPSRGIPRPIADIGKQITGGFGDPGEAQYFALQGDELLKMGLKLMDELEAEMVNDLRFHLAITYPRVTIRLKLEVEGWAKDAGFERIKQVVHDKTPIAVAESMGAAPTAFELTAQRREFDDDGNAENPPDRLRDELGLEKPRKQTVQAGAHKILVDRPSSLDGSF